MHLLQDELPEINRELNHKRDGLDEEVIENMMAGYRYVGQLLSDGVHLFALGSSRHLLEINRRVLCGPDWAQRHDYARHFEASERYFYEQREGGIGDLAEWYQLNRSETPWNLAAGAYIRVLSTPQLFIEGNCRSGALLMSYLLARAGRPPFVLTPAHAPSYFRISSRIAEIRKKSLAMWFRMRILRRHLADLLIRQCDPDFLA